LHLRRQRKKKTGPKSKENDFGGVRSAIKENVAHWNIQQRGKRDLQGVVEGVGRAEMIPTY